MPVRNETVPAIRAPRTAGRVSVASRRRAARASGDTGRVLREPAPVEHRYVRRVALGSVARVSVLFHLCGLVAFLVAAMVLWIVASAFGVVGEVEGFMDDLGFEGFEFVSGTLLWAGLLIGLAVTAILVVLTVFAAALYNLFADLAGGIEIELTDGHQAAVARARDAGVEGTNGNGAPRR